MKQTKNIFNPKEWLNSDIPEQQTTIHQQSKTGSKFDEVEELVKMIEDKRTDLTSTYEDWRNIGFALAEEFGENGRDFFLRLGRFHPKYNESEANKQFSSCLKSGGSGVSLKSLFFRAKNAGINISLNRVVKDSANDHSRKNGDMSGEFTDEVAKSLPVQLPTFPESLFPQLPEFLKKVVAVSASDEERDILLLGSITAISGCLPKLFGIYDGRKVHPNLFLFITAQASAGKGRLIHCRQLVNLIHKELRDQAKILKQRYEVEMAQYNAEKGKNENAEKPAKPPERMLFIPANNSSTGAYQLLGDSDGRGIIFETEGDTLAQAFKSDYGNYSDGFRKAFHHETISYYRRTDREYVDIDNPCLSTVLSGTPQQIAALIPSAENGLFSRFMFYSMNVRPVWKNVFESATDNGLEAYFDDLGFDFYNLYGMLLKQPEIQFTLTTEQQIRFNHEFTEIQKMYTSLKGLDYMASVRRLGLIAFRICMILSVLRIMETGEVQEKMICGEKDFNTALALIKVLVKHSAKVFSDLPQETKAPKRMNRKERFLGDLPRNFSRQKYLEVAAQHGIPGKTAEGYIATFKKDGLLHHEGQDDYINLTVEEVKESEETGDG
ncbi:DUF3987 domain-containing protein [Kaistella faecalis]|uniref:DUF3987 domain-containing protein n=1 Tax=Kaistella faecalis TaxID=2852098 RepID=UPI001C456A12|nr:DUF3987 domain-containing protein [Chryseobacterium faecale]UFK97702.1 DUF3987 domain-containing protein [Chryseobacterium faecale]